MEIIDPKSDLGFKSVMAHRPKIFMNVINTLIPLPKPVVEIKYINPELIAETNIHTVYVPGFANECVIEFPVPVVPSPNVQVTNGAFAVMLVLIN